MDTEQLLSLAEEAYETLETALTVEDREALQDVYKDVSSQIKWGQAINNAFPILLDLAKELIETNEMCKNKSPWYAVGYDLQKLFGDEDPKTTPRRHLLLLLLAKKLLGGLKTRVNQRIGDIRVLSLDEEMEFQGLIDEAESLEADAHDSDNDQEVVAEVDIAPEEACRQGTQHARVEVRIKRLNGAVFSETRCKDCRSVVKRTQIHLTTSSPLQPCKTHPGAAWKEGLEGQEAVCTTCKEPIEDPSTFDWVGASLEPYGDDPTKDEAIILCSNY